MSSLKKLLNLIEKTGDKAIVVDENGNPKYVIMDIFDYENLVNPDFDLEDLTEGELLDRINQDITDSGEDQVDEESGFNSWCSSDFFKQIHENEPSELVPEFNPIPEMADSSSFSLNLDEFGDDEEDKYYFEPVE